MTASTPRSLRVGEEIRRILSSIFQENMFWDPRLREASLTITEARVSADLKSARVFFIPFGERDPVVILQALKEGTPRIRQLLSQKIKLRAVPTLAFCLDTSYEKYQQVNDLLKTPKIQKDLTKEDPQNDE